MRGIVTKQHIWVKHVITPVHMIEDDAGNPVVLVDPDQQDIAEDNAVYGCDVCGKSMALAMNTECEGEGEDGPV